MCADANLLWSGKIIPESVDIAKIFNNESIKCNLMCLNSNLMNQYIEYVADRLICIIRIFKNLQIN